ncbi:MAG: methyltransferase domain-containing protein, partial [Myxococcales bacterium]|nr:methyltransferase domain-containing protein [Myxococcales bacterium]
MSDSPSTQNSPIEPVVVEEPQSSGVTIYFEIDEVLYERQSAHQHVMVADTPAYGRALFLDRLIQSTSSDEVLYHEPLIHPALLIHGAARRVLVAGAGEGASLRELLRHSEVERIIAVDLDPTVVEASRAHLQDWHQGAFDDPRVDLRFEDIQHTLAESADGSFDVIVLDITDPVEDGPSVDLFTVRFYREVARVLADDGIVVLQAG